MMVGWVWATGVAILLLIEGVSRQRFRDGVVVGVGLLVGVVFNAWFLMVTTLLVGYWTREVMMGVVGLSVLGVMWWQRRRVVEMIIGVGVPWRWPRPVWAVLLLIVGQVGFLAVTQLTSDYLHSDGLAIWFMKGKLFYLDGGVRPETLTHPVFGSTTEQGEQRAVGSMAKYPLLVPLNIAWTYLVADGEAVTMAKGLWVGLQASIIWFLYITGVSIFGKKSGWTVLMPVLYVFIPVMWRHFTPHWFGGADLWLAGLYLMGLGANYLWQKGEGKIYLWLAAWLLGGAAFTKIEGAVALVGGLVMLWVAGKKRGRELLAAVPLLLVPVVGWYIYGSQLPLKENYLGQIVARLPLWQTLLGRAGRAAGVMGVELFNFKEYLGLWPMAIFLPIWAIWMRGIKPWYKLYLLPLVGFGFIWFSYTFNHLEFEGLVFSTLPRLYSQWIPSALFLSVLALRELVVKKSKKE